MGPLLQAYSPRAFAADSFVDAVGQQRTAGGLFAAGGHWSPTGDFAHAGGQRQLAGGLTECADQPAVVGLNP